MASVGADLDARVQLLRAAGAELEARATRQQDEEPAILARRATLPGERTLTLSPRYTMSSGGGVPWVVDERAAWYKPHERARFSCANCSGDVVPEFDLVGCWPLWPQFGPDEMKFTCTRKWTIDPGMNHPKDFTRRGSTEPLPCWQTCWIPLGGGAKHCTAACPEAGQAEAAVTWRQRWDR